MKRSADAAREAARRPNGRFGHVHRDEEVGIQLEPAHKEPPATVDAKAINRHRRAYRHAVSTGYTWKYRVPGGPDEEIVDAAVDYAEDVAARAPRSDARALLIEALKRCDDYRDDHGHVHPDEAFDAFEQAQRLRADAGL